MAGLVRSNLTSASARFAAVAIARPGLTALILGLVAALGYPPIHGWYAALPAFAAFVWLIHQAPSWRSALWRGYLFGWAHLTLANNWIANAFTFQDKMPEALGWAAVPLLAVYLAIYPALAALAAYGLAAILSPRAASGEGRAMPGLLAFGALLAASWIVFEWVRGWAFTGYPWPPLGLVLLGTWETPGIARALPWLGTYGLSGLAVLIAALFAWTLATRRWLGLGALAAGVAAAVLLPSASAPRDSERRYVLVQPLIPQDEINDPVLFEEQFARLARLTGPSDGAPRLVFWPESAIPDYLEDGYPQRYYSQMTAAGDPEFARQRLAALIGPGSLLLTGVVNLDIVDTPSGARVKTARNSVIALDDEGAIIRSYDKAHLVPYGEYLPLRAALEPLGLSRLVAGSVDYRPGPGPRTLDLGGFGKAGIQICYEIVFSGAVAEDETRPDYLFNPSNDGWFGSWGPPQHLAQARMRAIEEGLPVLRSTTTGISAVIDARGIVRRSVALGKAGALEGAIPQAGAVTLFARLGNALPLGWAALLIVLAAGLPRLLALDRGRS